MWMQGLRCGEEIVAYVFRTMIADLTRNIDPRLSNALMCLPKGMTVYETMCEC